MLKLAVCDDEKVFRSDLKRILATELELCGIDYHITEFDSGEALNYILKPYEPERIASVLHTALEALDIDAEKYYVIEQKGGSIRVPLSTVKYFSSDRRTVHAVTTDREYTFYEKLSDLEAELPDTFVRIHNRYLVHLKYLDAVRQNTAVVDGEELPVSRSCRPELSIAFAKYMLQ